MIKRIQHYARRHGIRATLGRAALGGKRMLSGGRMALFFCNLDALPQPIENFSNAQVVRNQSQGEVEPQDLSAVTGWNPEAGRELMRQRFALGATLWLFKQDGELAAYGWTLVGKTVVPHYFPLGPNDAHLFDFFVMPKFRGRGINPMLVRHILAQLAGEKRRRAFIEAAEWNTAQLTSLAKTPFQKMGSARKFRLLGKPVVLWSH